MAKDKLDVLYDALSNDGADVGTREQFKEYMLRPGDEGYQNRLKFYNAMRDDGAEVGDTYETFRDWLFGGPKVAGGSESGEDARGLEKTAEDAGTASGKTAGAQNAGGYKPSPSFLWNLHSSVNSFNEGSRRRKEQVHRAVGAMTPAGRQQAKAGKMAAQMAGTPSRVMGLTPPVSKDDMAVRAEAKQQKLPTRGATPYDVVVEDGERKTRWLLPDGRLTTDLLEADRSEYAAVQGRLNEAFRQRMRSGGLDPDSSDDVQTQAMRDLFSRHDADDAAAKVWEAAEARTAEALRETENNPFLTALPQAEVARAIEARSADMTHHDLQRMADEAWDMLGKERQDAIIDDLATALGKGRSGVDEQEVMATAAKIARAQSDRAMVDYAIKMNAPQSATEFFIRKAVGTNAISSLIDAASRVQAGTRGDMLARDEAESEYERQGHRVAGIGGTVTGFMFDPLMLISGGVGGSAVKGASWLAGRYAVLNTLGRGATEAVAERFGAAAVRRGMETLGGRLAAGVVGGAANFATFEGLGEGLEQLRMGGYRDPETGEVGGYSMGAIGDRAAHGLMMGAATGVVAPLMGNVSDKLVRATESTVGKMGIRIGQLGVSTVTEGTIFATPELIATASNFNEQIKSLSDVTSPNYIADVEERKKKIAELRDKRGDAMMDTWTQNLAMIAGFKAGHGLKSAPDRIAELSHSKGESRRKWLEGFETRLRMALDGRHRDLALSREEREELERNGHADLLKIVDDYQWLSDAERRRKARVDEIRRTSGYDEEIAKKIADAESPLPFTEFTSLMTDNKVSASARAKMYYYLTGNKLPTPTILGYNFVEHKDADGNIVGYTVQSVGAIGVITSRNFTSKQRAEVERNAIMRQAELNSIDIGERHVSDVYEEKRTQEACRRVSSETGAPVSILLDIVKNGPRNDVEQKWAERIFEVHKSLGDDGFDALKGMVRNDSDVFVDGGGEHVESVSKIRAAVGREFGVDVDKAIRKEPNRRSEKEQQAIEEYVNRLFEDISKKEAASHGAEPREGTPTAGPGEIAGLLDMGDDDAPGSQMSDAQRRGYDADSQGRRDIAIALADPNNAGNADLQEAWSGVVQRINEEAAYNAAIDREESKQMRHTDGSIHPAVLKNNEENGWVYIVDGTVTMTPDGTGIDPTTSDKSVIIYKPVTGKTEMIDPTSSTGLSRLGEVISWDDREAQIESTRQQYVQAMIDDAQGKIFVAPGQQLVLPNGEEAVVASVDGDNITVSLNNNTQANVSLAELQRIADEAALADYRQRHGIAEETSQSQSSGVVEGAPADYVEGVEITVRDDDGVEKPAMVMGRVRFENGNFVLDANGNIVEYFMDGEVKHSHVDNLNGKVVSHVPLSGEDARGVQRTGEDERGSGSLEAQRTEGQNDGSAEGRGTEPMPVDDRGKKDYRRAGAERTERHIYDELGLSEAAADKVVANNVKAAAEALKKARKAAEKVGDNITDPDEMVIAERKAREAIEDAEAAKAFWEEVQAHRAAAIKAERERVAAEHAERERIAAEKAAADEAARQAEAIAKRKEQAQRGAHAVHPAIREKWEAAPKIEGFESEIPLHDGTTVKGRYMLVESGSATPSHNAAMDFARSEGFPVDENGNTINDRDYERDRDAQDVTREMGRTFDSRAIQDTPVVSRDGVVLSGNGRTMAGELAARDNTDGAYLDHLTKFGRQYGFTPEQVSSMQHPRLVFVADEDMPYTTETFAKFNAQQMKSQDRTETAVKLGKTVPDNTFGRIVGDINRFDTLTQFYNDPKASVEAINDLRRSGVITPMQYAEMFDGKKVSLIGRQMLENMLLGKAFESNPDALRELAKYPQLRQSVVAALAEISNNKRLGDYSLEHELSEAIHLAYTALEKGRKQGDVVSDIARQLNLFPFDLERGSVVDYTNASILMLADVLNSTEVNKLRNVLALYNDRAGTASNGNLTLDFDADEAGSGFIESKSQIIKDVLNLIENGERKEKQRAIDEARERRKDAAEAEQGDSGTEQDGTAERSDSGEQPAGGNPDVGGRGTDDAASEELEKEVEPSVGPFGEIYTQFQGKPKEAITFLLAKRSGEAIGALHHKDIGSIDLVWGEEGTGHSDGYGLAKLAKYHPEVLFDLQEILDDMVVVKRSANRVQLESDKYKASVRLTWDEKKKTWLLTMFEKKNSALDNTTDTGKTLSSNGNDTATPESTVVSVGEGSENSETAQGKSEKSGDGGDVISGKPIQGLDGRSEEEVLAIVRGHIEEVLSDEGVDGVTLKGMALHGSRLRGDAKEGSDLDVVVEFDGDMREDDMFNMLNAESNRLSIDGISVDINPIREDKSGTLERYMERSRKYDESKGGRERKQEGERGQGALEAQRTEGQEDGSEEEAAIERKAKADGTWMTAPNGERSRLAPRQWLQTRTKAFKKWFGDSKIVDENGEPLVVYRGDRPGRYVMDSAQGSFFSDREIIADGYAGKEGQTYAVYLDIKNPAYMDNEADYNRLRNEISDMLYDFYDMDESELDNDERWQSLREFYLNFRNNEGSSVRDFFNDFLPEASEDMSHEELLENMGRALRDLFQFSYREADYRDMDIAVPFLRVLGYDGIIRVYDKNGDAAGKEYITFDPAQVKSATDNNGDFSRSNPDIRYAVSEDSGGRERTAEESRGKKADGVATRREVELRDALAEVMRQAGMHVVIDAEGQRVLDAANGQVQMQRSQGDSGLSGMAEAELDKEYLDALSVVEKPSRIEKLRNSAPVNITKADYDGKYALNASDAQAWIKDNLRGEHIIKDTGEKILISKVGAEEVTSHNRYDDAHLKSISSIPRMLENAIFIEEQASTKPGSKFDSFRYYVVGLTIDGVEYTAKIVVGLKDGKRYYDHRLTQMEKTKLIDLVNQPASDFTTAGDSPYPPYVGSKDSKLVSLLQTKPEEIAEAEAKMRDILDEMKRRRGYSDDSSYQGTSAFNGAAPACNVYFPTREERVAAFEDGEMDGDASLGDFMDAGLDLWDLGLQINDPRYYRAADEERREAIKNLREVVNGKKKTVTMYRSVPSSVKEESFRNGDWVTPSRKYAEENAEIHGWGDEYRIIEQEVPVDDVWWDGNDIAEWGYDNGQGEVYKNTANNRKSDDLVTRDDEGNAIPPSQRYDERKDDVRYFRTADGEVYGFVKDGVIYLDPKLADAETAIHEYGHLWGEALRAKNPAAWARLRGEMEADAELMAYVKSLYPELEGDALIDEVFQRYAGKRGAERLRAERDRMLGQADGILGKAGVVALFDKLRRLLERFWRMSRDLFAGKVDGLDRLSGADFADMMLADLLGGFNPNAAGARGEGLVAETGVADPFYSNAARAVENIKQNKAKAEQWKAMLTKAGGIKAGEDKWMGLTQWLDEHNGETLTKEQVLEFVRENGVKMVEREYIEVPYSFESLKREYDQWLHDEGFDYAQEQLLERFGDDADIAFDDLGGELVIANEEAAAVLLGSEDIINSTRLDFTTEGLDNKREIAFVVPGVEPYQEGDEVHFGPENEGRAVMWVRFGETTDEDGNRVLVIDEIQSNRHQDAREKGYRDEEKIKEISKKIDALQAKAIERYKNEHGNKSKPSFWPDLLTEEERSEHRNLLAQLDQVGGVPAAPFEKNWHEVAMKRMLRLAAEEGFDKVAWTTGEQQAERYSLGRAFDSIEREDNPNMRDRKRFVLSGANMETVEVNNEGMVVGSTLTGTIGKDLREVVGQSVTEKMMGLEDGDMLEGEDLRIGGEGMKGFYDQMLPRFMDKYGKKWGVKTGEVRLSTPGGEVMHSVDVTDAMRRSVLVEGQPLFQKAEKGEVYNHGRDMEYLDDKGERKTMRLHTSASEIEAMKPTEIVPHSLSRAEQYELYKSFKPVTNESTGETVEFYNSAFKKNHREGGLFEKIVPQIRDLFKGSLLAYSEEEQLAGTTRKDGTKHKEHRDYRGFGNYLNKVTIGGKKYYVRFTVQRKKSESGLHSTFVTNVDVYDNPAAVAYGPTSNGRGRLDYDRITDAKLRKYFELAKGSGENVEAAKGLQLSDEDSEDVTEDTAKYRIREDEPPTKTGIGYKVFVLKDEKLYPPMVANPNGEATPVGVWLDADAAPVAGVTKTGRQQVKAGGKGTQGGSGKLAYRPGWHLGEIPYALQFNRMNPETGQRELFPANFVWAEVEYANDVDYNDAARGYGINPSGKYQHSLAGLPYLPENGAYKYRTNPDPNTDPWIITGAMKVNRILKPSEVDAMVEAAGREPQQRQAGAITDEQVEALNAKVKRTMQEDRDMMRNAVQQMGEKLHTDINVIEDVESITHPNAAVQERRRKSKGWYDTATGQVNIVLANNKDVDDVAATVMHETVAHKGLRELIGEERYNEFLDEVYKHLRDDLKKRVDDRAGRSFMNDTFGEGGKKRDYESHRREQVDELFGELAQKPFEEFNGKERNLWQWLKAKVRHLLNRFLGSLKLPKWFELGDNELRYILWRSKERLEHGKEHPIDLARDIAKREELGLSATASPSTGKGETLYRDPDDTSDIWNDQSLGLDERITAAATRLANNHRDNRTMRDDAMRAIGGNLTKLRRAMSLQRRFDTTTVKRVADLARVLISGGYLNDMSANEVKRLLSAVKNSVGHDDVDASVQKVMDIMVDNQLKLGEATLHELETIRATRVDARGVEVQGALDPAGAHTIKVFKKARDLEKADIEEQMASAQQRMGSSDAAVADEAALDYTGLQFALEYSENIKSSKAEEHSLREELRQKREEASEAERRSDAFKQYVASVESAIRQNKFDRAQAYFDLVSRLSDNLRESIANAKDFREAEKQRIRAIQHNANSDMEGRPSNEHYKPKFMDKFVNNSFVQGLFAPLATFDQMLRLFGNKSANGEGYLYNRFMRGWVDARHKEIRGVREKFAVLDAKAKEIFGGKVKTWGDLIRRVGKLRKGTVSFWDGGEKQEHELSQGNLMYIYMVNKMLDGRMKLRSMGISEEDVANIEGVLDPRLKELADWLQEEFLVETRNEYNETHKRMFGASMAAIEDYFPLRILENALTDKAEDLDNPGKGTGISTATGSIIKRRRNNKPLDITNADALSVILDHIAEMEHWNAFAEFNRDLNTLRTYKRFRNQVKNMTTIYGSGSLLWKKFNDVCQMAAGTYRPPRAMLDEAAVNFAKGVTAAKVSFRIFTALKQFLSMPAYLPEARPDYLVANLATPWVAWNWCMENLPIFNERWRSRMAGDPRLLKSDMDWKMWRTRIVQLASRVGMSPNAFVDALTVSIGSYAIYKTRLGQYKSDGYSQDAAEHRAKQDAEVLYNQTQQSSEGAFTSTMQVDRSWLSVLFTIFRNASMSYERQLYDALRNFKSNLGSVGRARSIEFMTKQYVRDGIDEAQAEKNAKRKFSRQLFKDTLRVATFGYLLQLAWNLGAYLPYLLFGDDDDEKQKMWDDVWAHTCFGWLEGATGGDVLSQAGTMAVTGEGNPAYLSKDMPLTSDIMSAFRKLGGGKREEALADIVNLVVQSGIGVNPQSITDGVLAIVDACGDDLTLAHEATICVSRILQVPQSQIDKMYFDEVDLIGSEVSDYTPVQLAERYAECKVKRGRLYSPWSWDDAALADKEKKKAEKAIKERMEHFDDQAVNAAYLHYEGVYKDTRDKLKVANAAAKAGPLETARIMQGVRPEDMKTYKIFKQLDGQLGKIAKNYLNAKTPEEAALCKKTLVGYKSGMVKILGATNAEARDNAMRELSEFVQDYMRQYSAMHPQE